MLQLPALAVDDPSEVAGALVFADDADPELFHVVPQVPRLRSTEGVPALRFTRFRRLGGDAQDGQDAPAGTGRAGGFLEAGVELVLTEAEQAQITAALKRRFPGRGVRLAAPAYLDGRAELMVAPVGGGLVESVAGSSAPSLDGTMTASFVAGLSDRGARLLWDGLGTTPSVLAVGYDVTVVARLPESRVRVWFDAVAALRTRTTEPAAAGTSTRTALEQAGAAGVTFDDWPADASCAALREEVTTWGWSMITAAGDRLAAAADAAARAGHPEQVDAAAFSLELVQTRRTGVPWRLRPQGHLPGLPPTQLERCRTSADLDRPVFGVHEVQVLANVDFAGHAIAAVDVSLARGDARLDVSLTGPQDSAFFRYVVPPGEEPGYTYAHRVHLAHTAAVVDLPGGTARDSFHVVAVPPCGRVSLLLDAGAVDWSGVTSVTAEVVHAEPSLGLPEQREAISLDATNLTATWSREVPGPATQPLTVNLHHALADGRRHEVTRVADPGSRLLLTSPFERTVTLTVAADGGWTRQRGVVVEVELAGVAHVVHLGPEHERELVSASLLAGDDDDHRWRQTVTFADGHVEVGDWQPGARAPRIEVGLHPAAVLTVEPATDLVDWSRVRLVRLAVHHPPAGTDVGPDVEAVLEERALLPGGGAVEPISIELSDPADDAYSYEATYFLTDGTRRSVGPTTTSDRHLVLSPVP